MELLLGITILIIAILGMGIGLINNKPLQGSCGGQNGKIIINGVEMACPACGGDTEKCETNKLQIKTKIRS